MTLAAATNADLPVSALRFERPAELNAASPAEQRGIARDEVRMLVSAGGRHEDRRFFELPDLLTPADLIVVNRSATIPASLPARGPMGAFRLHLSTRYGTRLWLTEPRWTVTQPGPVGMTAGDRLEVAGVLATAVAQHPVHKRLWFVTFDMPIEPAVERHGRPIHYDYLRDAPDAEAFQTIFGDRPGSAEMPSAARPFTVRTLRGLADRSVGIATITLHTGVSSLDVDATSTNEIELYAEPFEVPANTVAAIEATQRRDGKVIAVGTTVVRALESAVRNGRLEPKRGFTRRVVRPGQHHGVADALLTGFHDSATSHLAMLFAFAGRRTVVDAYEVAIARDYLWHEFGDVHLLWRDADPLRQPPA